MERIGEDMTELTAAASEARQIARFMGFKNWSTIDDIALVDSVRRGFPTQTAQTVVATIDPDQRFVRVTDIIPKTTLHRRKNKQLTKDESEKVFAIAKLFAEVLRIYHGDTESAAMFLVRKHPMLEGRRPIDLATESIAGADLVMKLLAQADAGIAA
jgi:putative toxin-antitoxin system antitoxin component (TIGR02293 family)